MKTGNIRVEEGAYALYDVNLSIQSRTTLIITIIDVAVVALCPDASRYDTVVSERMLLMFQAKCATQDEGC